MGAIAAAVLVLVPLIITPGLLFYFDITPKVVCLLLGASAGALWLAAKGRLALLAGFRTGRWLVILLAAQALSLGASTAISRNPWLSVSGTDWRRLGVITYLAVIVFTLATSAYIVEHPRSVRIGRRAVSVAGLTAAVYGILQYLGWDPWLPAAAYHIGEGTAAIVRPPGTLGYASYFAAYLLIVAFAGVWAVIEEDSRVWRAVGFAATALAAAAIVVSGTRAAMLGLAVGAIVFLVWIGSRLRLRTAIVALGAPALAVLALYWSPWGAQLRSRVRWAAEEPLGGARFLLWRDSAAMGVKRPVLGYGPETFLSEFPRFQSVALAQEYPDFHHESPHNMFLDAFTSQGMLGLAALAGLCALGVYAGWRARSRAPGAAAALVAALAATCVSQQFTVLVAPTALFFLLTIGVLVAISGPETAPSRSRLGSAVCWLAVAAVLAVCAAMYFEADYALARCNRELDAGNLGAAIGAYQRARQWQMPGASPDLWYSRRLARIAQASSSPAVRWMAWRQAIEAASRATQTGEDPPSAWVNLAAFYAAQNDVADTVASLRSAAVAAPNWFKPHWLLAQALGAAGRWEEAEREALLAAHLNAGKNPEVAATAGEIQAHLKTH